MNTKYKLIFENFQVFEHTLRSINNSDPYKIHVISGDIPSDVEHEKSYYWTSLEAGEGAQKLHRIFPSHEVYWRWYEKSVRNYVDFCEIWWKKEKVSHSIFTHNFKPVWYFRGENLVGRLYRFETHSFIRLFSIVVEPEERGKGYGLEMISREVNLSRKPVHIRADIQLKPFYSKAGFEIKHMTNALTQPGSVGNG